MHRETSVRLDHIAGAVREKVANIHAHPPPQSVVNHEQSLVGVVVPRAQKLAEQALALLCTSIETRNKSVRGRVKSKMFLELTDWAEGVLDHGVELRKGGGDGVVRPST